MDIYANLIPQMIFLQSIFGYLVVCILYKWSVDWSKSPTPPPSLLNMLINMFLEPGVVLPEKQLYPGQGFVQKILLLMAAVCVPWLLITKPYLIWKDTKRIHSGYTGLVDTADPDDVLEAEEEGNGRAVIEDANDEEVRISSLDPRVFGLRDSLCVRNITTLEMLLSIKSFTLSNSVWGAYRTRRLTCVYGRCRLHMRSCPRCFGT